MSWSSCSWADRTTKYCRADSSTHVIQSRCFKAFVYSTRQNAVSFILNVFWGCQSSVGWINVSKHICYHNCFLYSQPYVVLVLYLNISVSQSSRHQTSGYEISERQRSEICILTFSTYNGARANNCRNILKTSLSGCEPTESCDTHTQHIWMQNSWRGCCVHVHIWHRKNSPAKK